MSDHSDKPKDNFSLWDDHHKLVYKSRKTAKPDDAISDKLSIYLCSPVGRLNENPYEMILKFSSLNFTQLHKNT